MTHANPEAEAQKTLAMFKDSAECKTDMTHVWAEMARESRGFGGGTADDQAYFNKVAQGLKASGLMPELTIEYARMHQDDLTGDNGQIGKHDIGTWEHERKAENHRITPVEQALIDGLKTNFDAIKNSTKLNQDPTDGITDYELNNYQAWRSQERHAREQKQQDTQEKNREAQDMLRGMRDSNGAPSQLFGKLSDHGVITPDTLQKALDFDNEERFRNHYKGQSYLNGQDRAVIIELQNNMGEMTSRRGLLGIHRSDNKLTMNDIVRYAKDHGGT